MTYDILPKVRNMTKYEVTDYRRGGFHFGKDSHLVWPRLVVLCILLTVLRATKSRDIFASLYGYRAFVNRKWLPLNM